MEVMIILEFRHLLDVFGDDVGFEVDGVVRDSATDLSL